MTTTGTAQAREADLLLGRKAVWEFDPHTRGWKLCVDADVNITDIQIGAVEIKDHITDDRAHVSSDNLLHVFDHASTGAFVLVWLTFDYPEDSPHTSGDYLAFVGGVRQHDIASPVSLEGDYQGFIFNDLGQLHTYTTGSHVLADTELPVAALLSDIFANPTAPAVGAFAMGYYPASGTWSRLTVDENDFLEVTLGTRLDETTDEVTAYVTGTVQAIIQTGTVTADTELPAAVALADGLANPTTPLIGAATLALDDDLGTWKRVRGYSASGDGIDNDYFSWNMNVNAIIWGINQIGDMDRMRSEGASGSYAFRTSSWAMGQASWSPFINRSVQDWDERELVVYFSGSSVAADTELPTAAALADATATPTAPAVGAFGLGWDEVDSTWDRLRQEGGSGSYALRISAWVETEHGFDSLINKTVTDWDNRELVVYFSGSSVLADTELPTAVVLADGMANPTAPAVASHLMGFNGVTWDRAYIGISGSLKVDLATRLDKTNDEVTAYVTGTVGIDFMPAAGIGISGTVVVDTELPAAAALADGMATPTAPAVGAFGLGWDEVDSTWDRLRQEGASGSYALRTSAWVAGAAGYEELINRSVAAWSDRELLVHHSGTHVTMVTGSAVNIHGQTRTIERSIINITGSAGEYMLITGVAGQKVKVTEVMAITSADTELIFESGWTGTWKSGKLSVPADGDGFFCGACATPDQHHFETDSGDILVLRLVAGAQVGGWINWYYE